MVRSQVRAGLFGREPQPIRLGRFIILGRLGAGGMGVVYGAYDPHLDRKVALKLLRSDVGQRGQSESQARLDELLLEARAMARLSHVNVLTVFDVGEVDGRVYIAMEHVEAPTLRAWLSEEPSAEAIVEVMMQAAEGLAAAHEAGLVHRDFKPENVLVPPGGPVRVMDFGLARSVERSAGGGIDEEFSGPGSVSVTRRAGTLQYMAPEQLHGGTIDARADQWAFCATFFEALYRRPAFFLDAVGGRTEELVLPPMPPVVGLQDRVVQALKRGLSAKPEGRFESMQDLIAALRPRGRGRRRLWFGIAAAVVVALLFGYIVGLQGLRNEELCPAEQARVQGIWSLARAEQLKERFGASGLRYADQSATRVISIFDAYADAWVAAKRSDCLRDLGGVERADAESSCLDGRLEAWALTLDLLLAGDDAELATTVERSISIAAGLPDLHGCTRSLAQPSLGPLSAGSHRALGRQLHRVRTLLQARQLDAAAHLLEDARAELPVDRDEVDAQISLLEAELALLLAKSEVAMDRLDRVIELAGSVGLLHLIAEAAVMQAEVEGVLLRDSEAARPLLRVARIALATASSGPLLRGHLELVQARVEYSSNHFDAGRRATEAAIAAFDLAGERGHVKLGQGLQLLAVQAFGAGDYQYARTVALRALDLQMRLLGDAHPDLAKTIQVLGALELVAGHGPAAVVHFKRAAKLLEESLGDDHPNYGQILVNLGNAYVESEDSASALVQYQRAQVIFEAALRPEDPRVLGCLINIGGVQRALGDPLAAERAFREVIVQSREQEDSGKQSLAMALANLARVLQDQGRMGEAEEAHKEALSIRKSSLGPDHPKTAASYDALGRFLLETGRHEQGAPLIDEALAIRERRLGREHPDFARSQVNHALVLRARQQLPDAVETLESALALLDREGSQKSRGDARWQLARVLSERRAPGDLERATGLLARARREVEGTLYARDLEAWCATLGGAAPCSRSP